MTRDKQIKAFAKSLIKLCTENGEFSEEKASAVLQALQKNPPRNFASLLKEFLKLVRREVANSTAEVEYAGTLSDTALENIKSKLSAQYGRKISVSSRQNDSLIAGLRVRVGCDVYDSSIASSLAALQSSLS